ncbi:hypothetical protein B296_00055292 [Ensete ventricosum]|uniref:Uncharacterized protein n=1 Tax=Ensete ventricosum TaxID=4639 RepID=A0A426X5F9_ENSVE|nr:hypothetical protein B296_00055292 [Ensete ventricosum]
MFRGEEGLEEGIVDEEVKGRGGSRKWRKRRKKKEEEEAMEEEQEEERRGSIVPSLIVLVASGIVPSSPSPLPPTPLSRKELSAAPDHSYDHIPLHGTHWYLHLDFFLGGIQPSYADDQGFYPMQAPMYTRRPASAIP